MLRNKSPSSVHSLIREVDKLKQIKVHHQRMKNLSKTQSNQIRNIERCIKYNRNSAFIHVTMKTIELVRVICSQLVPDELSQQFFCNCHECVQSKIFMS